MTKSPSETGPAKGGHAVGCSNGYEFELRIFLHLAFSFSSCSFFLVLFSLFVPLVPSQLCSETGGRPLHVFADDISSKEMCDPFSTGLCHWGGRGPHPLPSGVSFQTLCSCSGAFAPASSAPGRTGCKLKRVLKGVSVLHLNGMRVLIFVCLLFKFSTEIFLKSDVDREIYV